MAARTRINRKTVFDPRKLVEAFDTIEDTLDALDAAQGSNADRLLGFTGKNGAGACTLTGALVGDLVLGVVNLTDGGTATSSFEGAVTVVDQIQQSSVSDLSSKKFAVLVRTIVR